MECPILPDTIVSTDGSQMLSKMYMILVAVVLYNNEKN